MRILSVVLAGGEGKRLYPLTRDRAKPAVPFGGRYRIVDFVLSNMVNSGFLRIKVLTQFKSNSLNNHISRYWALAPNHDIYVELVPAQMRVGPWWYKGSADAIFQNLDIIIYEKADYVCVFGADHVYRMDIRQMLDHHIEREAELTVAAVPVPVEEAASFGIIEVDREWKMIGFAEKPEKPKEIPNRPGWALASMGNYIFNTEALVQEIKKDAESDTSSHDFGRNIIASMFERYPVYVYDFSSNIVPGSTALDRGYWKDVGDIDTYWKAHMDMVAVSPSFNLYNYEWPIRTGFKPLPPAKFVFANEKERRVGIATDSMVSEGCIISGGHINRSVLGPNVRINSFAYVTDSVLLEGVEVGRYVQIRNTIIDKHSHIANGVRIGYDPEADRKRFTVTPNGIVVIARQSRVEK